jgi:hypothetical protein
MRRIASALLSRLANSFRREPQLALVISIALIIGFLSLSPTLMLFYGSFRSKPLGVRARDSLSRITCTRTPIRPLMSFC